MSLLIYSLIRHVKHVTKFVLANYRQWRRKLKYSLHPLHNRHSFTSLRYYAIIISVIVLTDMKLETYLFLTTLTWWISVLQISKHTWSDNSHIMMLPLDIDRSVQAANSRARLIVDKWLAIKRLSAESKWHGVFFVPLGLTSKWHSSSAFFFLSVRPELWR